MDLSVVIPAYQSALILEDNLPVLLAYLRAQPYAWEVLIVDDGSRDDGRTQEAAQRHGCAYLRHAVRRGKGAAVRTGMRAATGRYRIFTDADIPYELDAIDRILRYLDVKEFHLVTGDRTLPESVYYADIPWARRVSSKLFSLFVGRLVVGGLYDTQCGIKGFRAEAAQDIFGVNRVNGFAMDVECFYVALKRNYDIKRIPVALRCQDGRSVNIMGHGLAMAFDVLRIVANGYLGRYARQSSHRTGDHIAIGGDYQDRAYFRGSAPQRFWHAMKFREAQRLLDLQPGDRVLDAGCGSGVFAGLLPGHVEVIGVDANPRAVEFALAKFRRQPNASFRLGLLDEMDFSEHSFDKIACLEVLEHLTEAQAASILERFGRWLRPGGVVVLSTPNQRSIWPLIEWAMTRLHLVPSFEEQHEHLYDAGSLESAGRRAGFTVTEGITINLLAPWLAAVSWRVALLVHRLETRLIGRRGPILIYGLQKPLRPDAGDAAIQEERRRHAGV